MGNDMIQILRKTPLRCFGNEIEEYLYKGTKSNESHVSILMAIEYGRILGKREERARMAKRQTIMEE